MKKILIIFVVYLLLGFTKTATAVYVCDSKGATRYHLTSSCRGLNACKHQIIEISQVKAGSLGLTLCKWEE